MSTVDNCSAVNRKSSYGSIDDSGLDSDSSTDNYNEKRRNINFDQGPQTPLSISKKTSLHPLAAAANIKVAADKRGGLLRQQVELRPRGDGLQGKEIVPIPGQLSEDKGLYTVVRAIQLLKNANNGRVVIVGLGGPSGAGKTEFSRRLGSIIPLLHISLDSYADGQKMQENGKTDDPSMTDFDLLIQNIIGLNSGEVEIPLFDFKLGKRTGYKMVRAPESQVILIEGMYALYPKVRPYIDLRVAISGGVHFDLIKRIMRDTGAKSESIHPSASTENRKVREISEAVFPNYKTFIEPDLKTAHIRVRNQYNPFSGFLHNATYTLKSSKKVSEVELESMLNTAVGIQNWSKGTAETTDIFLLPPGEDQETCKNWIRMRRRDGHYSLVFEEYISDGPMLISPSMSFEVNIQLLGGLLGLGYQLGAVITRFSTTYESADVSFKFDDVDVLKQRFLQLESKNRETVEMYGKLLCLDGTYTPMSYIELLQLERLSLEMTVDVNKLLMVPSHVQLSPNKFPPFPSRAMSPRLERKKTPSTGAAATLFSPEDMAMISRHTSETDSQSYIMNNNVSRVYSDCGSDKLWQGDEPTERKPRNSTSSTRKARSEAPECLSDDFQMVKQQLSLLRQSQDALLNQITCLGFLVAQADTRPLHSPSTAVYPSSIGLAGCLAGVGLLAIATQFMFINNS
eukprot:CAMPEP_0196574628 /NCGR_PEP_ID=MMETSP1081-20130531/4306_1 /TAXON_ID=36882 /ORGANISM="Pyramimonas amylifera, Strain CCMP720" /LENGTH=682 /DNA_ID=CAMNT_0041892715 /DNA_START=62 /DNA_END=2110 /DNA_ORIENTATION=+